MNCKEKKEIREDTPRQDKYPEIGKEKARGETDSLISLFSLLSYVSKQVEKKTAQEVVKAEIDVIGILLVAQTHNAKQLAAFCLHYISTNFRLMQKREGNRERGRQREKRLTDGDIGTKQKRA